MKIKYNSPVILTYTLFSICVFVFFNKTILTTFFSSPAHFSFSSPLFYLKLVLYIAGHGDWGHLMGTLMIVLIVGPLLEEKHGSRKVLEMMLIASISTALLNTLLFSTSLIGGSGVVFMFIFFSSFSNINSKEIPLTFIIITALIIGSEVTSILKTDQVSQFSHLAGGLIGAGYGFFRSKKNTL
ncbi:MAG: rhomboid family intramembrane serine protease [Desulfobacteraceae bacterium]|nr:rhomboid family intramembrane serine protease [Desulfobacteraceae bacterium]